MFYPKYTISPKILANIKKITELTTTLNSNSFPKIISAKLEKSARSLSAHSSTSIEGNPLPLTEVRKLLKNIYAPEGKPEHVRDSEQEVLNYNQALQYLYKEVERLNNDGNNYSYMSLGLVLKIQKLTTDSLLPTYQSGKFRKEAVVVYDSRSRQIQYMAPNWQEVPELMDDLLKYVNENINKTDPLILAGIFHRQFVIIHPFIDGNGRTTRLLSTMILALLGINIFNLFSFENYYNQNISRYIKNVGSFGDYYDLKDEYDFTKWLEYFTEGIIDELMRVSEIIKKKLLLPTYVLRPGDSKLLRFIKENGSITDSQYSKITKRAKATRNLDFNRLIDLQKIQRVGSGKATYYIML